MKGINGGWLLYQHGINKGIMWRRGVSVAWQRPWRNKRGIMAKAAARSAGEKRNGSSGGNIGESGINSAWQQHHRQYQWHGNAAERHGIGSCGSWRKIEKRK